MKLVKRKPSGREKDEASMKLLEQLRGKLYSGDTAARRWAAFNLSRMQEDGLDILKEALFSNFPKTVKNAAAYGLRSMRGRMKKKALEVFEEGLNNRNSDTREMCKDALLAGVAKAAEKSPSRAKKAQRYKSGIKGIPGRTRPKAKAKRKKKKEHFLQGRSLSKRQINSDSDKTKLNC